MSEFALVDLGSQARAFRHYIEGWKPDDVVKWLAKHGQLKAAPDGHGGYTYLFRSGVGIETGFFFNKNGQIVFIGDHTTF